MYAIRSYYAEIEQLGAKSAATAKAAAAGKDMVIMIRPEKESLRPDIYGPEA